jgi:hypothetical protein
MKRTLPRWSIFLVLTFSLIVANGSGSAPGETAVFNLIQQFNCLAARPRFAPGKTPHEIFACYKHLSSISPAEPFRGGPAWSQSAMLGAPLGSCTTGVACVCTLLCLRP